jgi:hypothetical protein
MTRDAREGPKPPLWVSEAGRRAVSGLGQLLAERDGGWTAFDKSARPIHPRL